ncbi:MAG: J domain-containing protein [Bdellovibrionales bacterium]|nr:J domain-containing protein [Bdellovibrionales bacterium]
MEILNYYIKTLSTAGGKLLPVGVFLLVGYFLFIKLPFYFFKKVKDENKIVDENLGLYKKDSAVEFKTQEKMKLDQTTYQERLNQAREEKERQQKRREQETKQESKQESKKQESKKQKPEEPKKAPPKAAPAEEIFEIPAGQTLNKSELKKRYFELLKQNHPDKVASLGNDFKVLAEKKTKAINSAYEELKKKAS